MTEAGKKKTQEREIRSKQVKLLMRPSVYQAGKDLAKERGISFNELMNRLLKQELEGPGDYRADITREFTLKRGRQEITLQPRYEYIVTLKDGTTTQAPFERLELRRERNNDHDRLVFGGVGWPIDQIETIKRPPRPVLREDLEAFARYTLQHVPTDGLVAVLYDDGKFTSRPGGPYADDNEVLAIPLDREHWQDNPAYQLYKRKRDGSLQAVRDAVDQLEDQLEEQLKSQGLEVI